jgi:MFS family permease
MLFESASTLPPGSASTRPRSARLQSGLVYASGVVQGIVLVTFPAANSIFTDRSGYGLSSTQFGLMFVPQVIAAIAAALCAGILGARFGTKRVYQLGISAGFVAMALLVLSQFSEANGAVSYPILLVATGFLGAGFGLTVSTLNTLTAAFHPKTIDRSVLILNALLGVGTALAPVFVAVFVSLGFWWGLPALMAVVLVGVLAFSLGLPLKVTAPSAAAKAGRIPARFWLYAGIALLYGVIETMSGNWAGTFMRSSIGSNLVQASIALTAFWAAVTFGRVGFAILQKSIGSKWPYRIIPIFAAVAYVLISLLPHGSSTLAIAGFVLAGIGCSALLPLTISLGEEELTTMTTSVSGRLIASYQVGYGIAAFGVGPLLAAGARLGTLYQATAVIAIGVAICGFAITRSRQARALD